MTYVPLGVVYAAAGISRQALERACLKIVSGATTTWNGAHLEVRQNRGAGGRSGFRYEIRVDSLPVDLQERLKHAALPATTRSSPEGISDETTRRFNIIAPIVAHQARTPERRRAKAAILLAHPSLKERTLDRWIASYDAEGIGGLRRKQRDDKGEKRCLISQAWFNEASKQLDRAAIEAISNKIDTRIRSMVAAGEPPKRILYTSSLKLRELSIAAGFVATAQTSRRTFEVPRARLTAQRTWIKAATKRLDAKSWRDKEPAIRRELADRPLQYVDIDAMHFDHIVTRPDGSVAYPKAIVFSDRATYQAFMVPFLLGKGEGIRQQHVAKAIENFITAHGVPETFYIDNGGEFRAVDDLSDILQLLQQVRSIESRAPVVRAKPYGARAKVVETIIGVLQRAWLSGIPGHVGNNRINRVTQQVGRPTTPFPGSFEQFADIVELRVREYNDAPQRGNLKGRSPNDVLQAHIDNGFERHAVDRNSLILAFSKRDTRDVKPFGIQFAGQWWTCRELQYRSGEKIGILRGRFYDWPTIPLYDLDDPKTIIDYAAPHLKVDGMDPANARESRSRKKGYNKRGRELIASAAPYDAIADTREMTAFLPPPPAAPISATIVPDRQAAEIVSKITEPKQARELRERRERAEQERKADARLSDISKKILKNGM